ncbi:MAG: ABC transporter ATP-binding protein/permease [Verrucomicrobiae bacterium]|nr:ABC transporter ATP-binding protein/permease [Verrucomicrobiae bacterium]NNJ44024.1 ABC transporter ATP-binding protein [Akkermansiaceae bacterium]
MPSFLHNSADLIHKVYTLARPFGRKRLLIVIGCSFAQGLFQVLGVTSIFPFLALAADPSRLRNSQFGTKLLEILPPFDDSRLLLIAGIFAIAMLLVANGVNLSAEFVRTRYAHQFSHWLRVRLLRQIATRPYTDFLEENTGVLVKKVLGDVMGYTTGVLLPLLDSLARIATIILLIGTLFLVHPQIAIVASLGFGLFYVAVFRGLGRFRSCISNGLKDAFRGTYIEVQQMLGGIKPVKVHRAEETFIERFSTHSERNARLQAWSTILGNGPRYLIEPLAFGGLVVVVIIYAARGQDIIAILPNLGVMALAGYRLLPALQLLYGQITQFTTQRHTLEEVFDEFLAVETAAGKDTESADGRLTAPEPLRWQRAITLEDLSFQYPGGDKPVISNLNLTIPKNSSLGIVGTTGCGKSTLVDLILGLHAPSFGRILIDDTPLGADNRRAWRGGIGYVPQEIFLIDDTVAANIAFGVPKETIDPADLERAAAAAQIREFIEHELPQGWETVVGERGVRLSGGQRQRIGLARALYHQPELLVLDEATSALDTKTEDGVIKAIAGLSGQITMLVIAHRLRTVEMCDERLNLAEVTTKTSA